MLCFNINLDKGIYEFYFDNSFIPNKEFNFLRATLTQEYSCDYDSTTRRYFTSSAIVALSVIDFVKGITKIEVPESDITFLKELIYPVIQVKKKRLPLPQEFLTKYPPLKGKEGFENFQTKAMSYVLENKSSILNIYMRHGKTYITCGAMYQLFKREEIDKVLILCKPEGVENFRLEILRFLSDLIKEDDIGICTSHNREIKELFNKKIIITTYNAFRLSCQFYQKQPKILKNGQPSKAQVNIVAKPKNPVIDFSEFGKNILLLCDETQSLNTHDSLQTHFVAIHRKYFDRLILMSGTIGYKFEHYYSLVKLVNEDMIPYSYSNWIRYVANVDKGIVKLKAERVQEFKENVIDKVQITFKDCLILSPHYEKKVFLSMNDKMKKLYREFADNSINNLKKEKTPTGKEIRNKFPYLTQITSDPSLVKEDIAIGSWKIEDNPKVEIIKSLLDKHIDTSKEKVIIWTLHPSVALALSKVFTRYNPVLITGNEKESVKREDRMEELDKFKKDPTRKLLIATYILTTSISLIEATTQIFYDLTSSSDTLTQCKERFAGPMQKNNTTSYFLLFNNSIDIYVWYNIIMKKQDVHDILSSKEELSLSDYKSIFNAKGETYEML